VTANVPIIGNKPTPDAAAEYPSTLVMNCGKYSSAAKKIADISSVAMQAGRKARFLSTSLGTSAIAPARRSINTNPTSATVASAKRPTISGSVQPKSIPSSSADQGTLSDHRVDYGGIALLSIGLFA